LLSDDPEAGLLGEDPDGAPPIHRFIWNVLLAIVGSINAGKGPIEAADEAA